MRQFRALESALGKRHKEEIPSIDMFAASGVTDSRDGRQELRFPTRLAGCHNLRLRIDSNFPG